MAEREEDYEQSEEDLEEDEEEEEEEDEEGGSELEDEDANEISPSASQSFHETADEQIDDEEEEEEQEKEVIERPIARSKINKTASKIPAKTQPVQSKKRKIPEVESQQQKKKQQSSKTASSAKKEPVKRSMSYTTATVAKTTSSTSKGGATAAAATGKTSTKGKTVKKPKSRTAATAEEMGETGEEESAAKGPPPEVAIKLSSFKEMPVYQVFYYRDSIAHTNTRCNVSLDDTFTCHNASLKLHISLDKEYIFFVGESTCLSTGLTIGTDDFLHIYPNLINDFYVKISSVFLEPYNLAPLQLQLTPSLHDVETLIYSFVEVIRAVDDGNVSHLTGRRQPGEFWLRKINTETEEITRINDFEQINNQLHSYFRGGSNNEKTSLYLALNAAPGGLGLTYLFLHQSIWKNLAQSSQLSKNWLLPNNNQTPKQMAIQLCFDQDFVLGNVMLNDGNMQKLLNPREVPHKTAYEKTMLMRATKVPKTIFPNLLRDLRQKIEGKTISHSLQVSMARAQNNIRRRQLVVDGKDSSTRNSTKKLVSQFFF